MILLKFEVFAILLTVNAVFGDSNSEERSLTDTLITTEFYMAKHSDSFVQVYPDSLTNYPKTCQKSLGNELKVLVHRFSRTYEEKWIKKMRKHLVTRPDVTVIAINWRIPNCIFTFTMMPNTMVYKCAYEGIETVARLSAEFLEKFRCHYGSWKHIHILGHSMGVHIAGQIGNRLIKRNITVNRITGLDPALPRFEITSDSTLEKTHADFVDVIHTNSLPIENSTFGLYRSHGHIDIYANAGDDQPDCPKTNFFKILLQTLQLKDAPVKSRISEEFIGKPYPELINNLLANRDYLLCNHYYAPEYVLLSMVKRNCKYWAVPMANKGQNVDCTKEESGCVKMGINAETYHKSGRAGDYYIDMNELSKTNRECMSDNVRDIYSETSNIFEPMIEKVKSELKLSFFGK